MVLSQFAGDTHSQQRYNIAERCFSDLENLKSVYIGGQKFEVIVTQGSYGTKDVQGNCLERYLGEDERYVVDSDIKKIGEASFCNCFSIRELVILNPLRKSAIVSLTAAPWLKSSCLISWVLSVGARLRDAAQSES